MQALWSNLPSSCRLKLAGFNRPPFPFIIVREANATACGLACPDDEALDASECKCIRRNALVDPKFVCPQIKCSVGSPPCLAFRRTALGCQTCTCLYRCPYPHCPENCENRFEDFTDLNGCRSCRCMQPEHCKTTTCGLFCQRGYNKDEFGCDICKCRPCGIPCNIGCRYGRLVDFDGCDVCQCKPRPHCGPICKNYCPNGRVLDESGCPTCQCLEKQICGSICPIDCKFGRVIDENGCPSCQCRPDPSCGPECG